MKKILQSCGKESKTNKWQSTRDLHLSSLGLKEEEKRAVLGIWGDVAVGKSYDRGM